LANQLIKYIKEKNENGIDATGNWLLKNYEKNRNFIIWKTNFERPFYKLKKGWVSGFYQCRILKALYDLYEYSGEKKYYNLLLKGINAFEVDLNNGGLRIKGKVGYWYPEYAQKGTEPPYVLNGMIFCLLDLYYLYKKTKIKKIKKIFDEGLKELLFQIDKYDKGNWTYYDRIGNPARYDYHLLHIKQMKQLYEITKIKKFKELNRKWSSFKYIINLPDRRFYLINVIILNILLSLIYLVYN